MLLKPSGWMRLALTAGLALTSLASSAADPVKIGLLEDASGNFALATIPKIHATQLAVDEIHVDQRMASMCLTLRTGVHARLTADAARGIDEKPVLHHDSAFRIRHADTLNSGILLRGSSVRCVNRFALRFPGQ